MMSSLMFATIAIRQSKIFTLSMTFGRFFPDMLHTTLFYVLLLKQSCEIDPNKAMTLYSREYPRIGNTYSTICLYHG